MNGTRPVRVVAVAPVHNRRDTTLRWLRAMGAIDVAGLDLACIVVDDGSTDGTADAIRKELSAVEIVPGDGNLWYTAGTNRGLAAALALRPDYVLAMNDDTHPDRAFLASLVADRYLVPTRTMALQMWKRMPTEKARRAA